MPHATVRNSSSRIRARTSSSEQPSSAAASLTVRGAGRSMPEVSLVAARPTRVGQVLANQLGQRRVRRVLVKLILVVALLALVGLGGWFIVGALGGRRR